jgi:protein-L-isoaspartate O-methyltransferase
MPMVIFRWGIGAVAVALFLLPLMVPRKFVQVGEAAAQQRQPRVYTNDDYPFNQPSSPAPAKDSAPASSAPATTGERLAPFVPSPMDVVDRMLQLAAVGKSDVVYDMGSGDGRIVIRAAERFGAKSVGIELDRGLAEDSRGRIKERGLEDKASIIQGDLLQTDFSDATVVTLYLLVSANDRLRPIMEKTLKPGTRVVAHDMRVPGWEAYREEAVTPRSGAGTHFVYLYRIPEAFQKTPTR